MKGQNEHAYCDGWVKAHLQSSDTLTSQVSKRVACHLPKVCSDQSIDVLFI
jgi:hypothetical protein